MLSALTGGLRALRSSLLSGFGVLAIVWLVWPRLPGPVVEPELTKRLGELFDFLGDNFKIGMLIFVAAMIGSAANEIVIDRALRAIERRPGWPMWDLWVETALEDLRVYEERTGKEGAGREDDLAQRLGDWIGAAKRPSTHYGLFLWDEYQGRVRSHQEMRFRLQLSLVSAVVVLCAAIAYSECWYLVLLVPAAVPAVDLRFRGETVANKMTTARVAELDARVEKASKKVELKREDLRAMIKRARDHKKRNGRVSEEQAKMLGHLWRESRQALAEVKHEADQIERARQHGYRYGRESETP